MLFGLDKIRADEGAWRVSVLDRLHLALTRGMIGKDPDHAKARQQPHADAEIIFGRPDMQFAFGC